MNELTNPQIRKLKALAQRLEPVVRIGKQGLSPALVGSLDQALAARELVKVKFADFKDQKKEMAPLLAQKTGSHLVTRVGNVAVFYREHADPARRKILV